MENIEEDFEDDDPEGWVYTANTNPGSGLRLMWNVFSRDSYICARYRALVEFRKAEGLTQQEVATLTGMPFRQAQVVVCDLERDGKIMFTGARGRMEWTARGYVEAIEMLRSYRFDTSPVLASLRKALRRLLRPIA